MIKFCEFCKEKIETKKFYTKIIFLNPYQEETNTLYFCNENHADKYQDSDKFARWFYCEGCKRQIFEISQYGEFIQQFSQLEGEPICNKCR